MTSTPTAWAAPLDAHTELPEAVGTAFAGVTTTEARLVATGVVLLAAALAAGLVVPSLARAVRRVAARGRDRLEDEGLRTALDNVPWTVVLTLFVRALQTGVLLLTGVSLLVVWERADLALATLAVLELSLPLLLRGVTTAALLLGAYLGTQLLEDRLARLRRRSERMGQHEEGLLLRISQVLLFSLVALVGLSVWEVNLGGLLVGAGFLGIVVGLAARQTLGSLVAGFVLMLSRPFEIGDWVLVDDEEGIVTDVTIINTHIRNFDGEFVVVPNDRVANSVVTNRTREGKLRLRVEVGVDYGADTARAEQVAREAIESIDAVANNPTPQVLPTGFADSAVTLETRFWIDNPVPPRKWRAIQEVVHAVKTAFEREGIKIPYPQRELSGRPEAGGFRVIGGGREREGANEGNGEGPTASEPLANDD
jgi:small-conductance mechanosensitive channel